MINHHPDENTLIEYAAGTLNTGISIAVRAHLQFCPQCRNTVSKLNQVGGNILNNCSASALEAGALDQLLSRIHNMDSSASTMQNNHSSYENSSIDKNSKALPKLISKLIAQSEPIKWRTVWPSVKAARLTTGQNQYEISLHKIRCGGTAPVHDHRGTEITLVLEGSFSDAKGVYTEGDFIVRQPGEIHQPVATQNQDCLCLSLVEAPFVLKGFLGWLINPLLSVRPA